MKVLFEVQEIDIDKVIPYWRNPRKNDKTVVELMKIISEVGFNQPILVDKNHVIIKGHSRYYAMKRLGKKTIPCIISEESDEVNNKNRIYDNAVQELSAWDVDLLRVDIEKNDIDLSTFSIPSLSGEQKKTKGKEKRADKKGAKDVLMKYKCPCCGKDIKISRNEVLSR